MRSRIALAAPLTKDGINAVRLMRAVKAADQSITQVTGYQVFKPLF
jgi:hypothetical protein